MEIVISEQLKSKCPDLRIGTLLFDLRVSSEYPELLNLISKECKHVETIFQHKKISEEPAIAAGRAAYRALGKEPARYRLSAEALLRRALNGKGLYQINNIVDALNLISLRSGISIGGYDFEKINGAIQVEIGRVNEPYQAIGRGQLNIENLPVLRDETGAFGSPTSDSTTTMVTSDTKQFLMLFFNFAGEERLSYWMEQTTALMQEHASGQVLQNYII